MALQNGSDNHQVTRVEQDRAVPRQVLTLRLRREGEEEMKRRRITWDKQVRDPVTQQSSKCCCVFHRRRLFGESSSSSSSSSDDGDGHSGSREDGEEQKGCCDGPHGADGSIKANPAKKKQRCTKEHCYCGTRFK